ncbi:fused MFS/spermidine synthase [Phycicoccus sp. CSK15P-2]|uniref:spermidine synthase n=1 Tax=Phycicoccus sp. CSK15P-2 TaxID=2807627 RepID=UPI0027DB0E7F|nr:fused MFS/spermidine synthase [Phycicoccus sp. CSK15P-2]
MGEPRFETDGTVVTVVLDDHPQSAVDLGDPTLLTFEYVQHLALCVEALAGGGPLRTTHVGGAGLTLARWLQHTRPGSPQVVLEPDTGLTEAVRRELPLPRGHRIRVRPVTGEDGMAALRDASADLVVLDAYAGGRVPAGLTTREWLRDACRVLGDAGLLLANLADDRGLRYVARVGAGAQETFGHVALVGLHEVLKGRRFGNVVLVASVRPLRLFDLRRACASAALPTGVLTGAELARKAPGSLPFTADDAEPSPEPPDRDGWRR